MLQKRHFVVLLLVALQFALPAAAVPIVTTQADHPVFAGAQSLSFDDEEHFSANSYDFGDIRVSVPQDRLFSVANRHANTPEYTLENNYLRFGPETTAFTLFFDTEVRTFGFTWAAANYDWNVDLYDSSDNLLGSAELGLFANSIYSGFYGISESSANIAYANFSAPQGDYVMLDSLVYTRDFIVSTVPEPGSLLLVFVGLLGLTICRKLLNADPGTRDLHPESDQA